MSHIVTFFFLLNILYLFFKYLAYILIGEFMLKKIYFRKIMVATLALFALFLIYLMPEKENTDYTLSYDNIEYIYTNVTEVVYLLDTNDYVARTTIMGCDCDVLETVKDVSKGLIIDGEKSHIIPNGFKPLIPNGTELLEVKLEVEK